MLTIKHYLPMVISMVLLIVLLSSLEASVSGLVRCVTIIQFSFASALTANKFLREQKLIRISLTRDKIQLRFN